VQYDGEYHEAGTRPLEPSTAVRPVRIVNGAGMLVRLAAVRDVGTFDERYLIYHDETAWALRALEKGWRLAVADASIILTDNEGTNVGGNALYFRLRNNYLLSEQIHGDEVGRQLAQRVALDHAEDALRARRRGDWVAVACAVRDATARQYGTRTSKTVSPLWEARMGTWLLRRRLRGAIDARRRPSQGRPPDPPQG
jgi:cellulose synthase/poly-beta-1,6-N-acetylglucosamine synthase-like glycosyltransferase